MANSIMATDSSFTQSVIDTIKNDTLRVRTQQLFSDGMQLQRARRAIAYNLVAIHKECGVLCREFDGKDGEAKFDTYGEKILGLKRAQLRALLRVGEKFIKDGSFDSVLQLANGDDFTTTQLQAIAPIGVPTAKKLVADGEIAPTMTVKQIKEVVFAHDTKAQERKAKRGAKASTKANEDKPQETQAKRLFALEVMQSEDKSLHVLINGKDVTDTKDKEVKRIVTYIIKNSKYITN